MITAATGTVAGMKAEAETTAAAEPITVVRITVVTATVRRVRETASVVTERREKEAQSNYVNAEKSPNLTMNW